MKPGILITGHAMISHETISEPNNLVIHPSFIGNKDVIERFKSLVNAYKGLDLPPKHPMYGHNRSAKIILQLNHPGRQVSKEACFSYSKSINKAISTLPRLSGRTGGALVFAKTSKASPTFLSTTIPNLFAKASIFALSCGFDGVEIHCGHGYLLSEPGCFETLLTTLKQVSKVTRKNKAILALKLNGSDTIQSEHYSQLVSALHTFKCDIIEVTGGSYVNPSFLTQTNTFPIARFYNAKLYIYQRQRVKKLLSSQPFFIKDAQTIRKSLHSIQSQTVSIFRKPPIPLVCVVGGISDPSEKYLERFCSDFSVDMVGVARSFLITSLVSNHKDIESTSQSCAQSPCEDHRRYSTIRMRATFHFIVVFLLWIVGLIFPMIKAGVESVYWQEFMKELPCSIDNSKSKKGWTIIRKKRKEMTKKQSKSSETYLSGQVVLKT
ncbi:hypothetical protein ADUPG1_000331, partial [Aduncisulcus paluster]